MKQNHLFGRLLKQYLQRGRGLTQNELADGIDQDAGVISHMCQGQRLGDRSRILDIICWLHQQGVLDNEEDATALLEAADHARLNTFEAKRLHLSFRQQLVEQEPPKPHKSSRLVVTTAAIEPGILNLHNEGIATIRDYDLWFSSFAQKQWQVWCLDPQDESLQLVHFALPPALKTQHLFVPAISTLDAKVVFAMNSTAHLDSYNRNLYLADLNGANVELLTNLPLDTYHPSWSPTGKLIVYHVEIDSDQPDYAAQSGIWVTNIESRSSRQLTNGFDYDPVWSPNGRFIAYHSMQPHWCIKILDYQAASQQHNYDGEWIAVDLAHKATSVGWMNNHEIIFASDFEGKWDLYQIPVAPHKTFINPERITRNRWNNVYPAVFDAKLLLWQAFPHEIEANEGSATDKISELFVMNLHSGKETPLITGIGNVRDGFLVKRTAAYLRQLA